jgi:hypothetical protein
MLTESHFHNKLKRTIGQKELVAAVTMSPAKSITAFVVLIVVLIVALYPGELRLP